MLNEYLAQLEELINIDSGSFDPDGINRVASYMEKLFLGTGWLVERKKLDPATGDLLVVKNREAERYDVMLMGHMDTVFPRGTAAGRPFTRDERFAYGPGVADMKQGVLAMYWVAKSLSPETLDKANIVIVCNPDEEIGSVFSNREVHRIAEKADRIFVFEAAAADGRHCFSRKGMIDMELEFTGKAAHSGYIFTTDNASAIEEAAKWVTAMLALADREKTTSVNIGTFCGGTATNVVPASCVIGAEVRSNTNGELDRVENALSAMMAAPFTPGVTVRFKSKHRILPMPLTDRTAAYIGRARAVADKLGIPFDGAHRGGISDANQLADTGAVILDAMGPGGDNDHCPEEYLDLTQVEPCIRLTCALIDDMVSGRR